MVVVVDDDKSVRKALERLLRANGYRVVTFESAENLLVSGFVPPEGGCMVLDICLPGISGLELSERLASGETRSPVIFVTAHENPQWQQLAAKMNAVAYLLKPFDQEVLLQAVRLACGGRETLGANPPLD
jgi:FixJ family two-component response regulator